MRLTEQHISKNKEYKGWCKKAKNLYNQCLYWWRQSMFKEIEYFTEYELVNLLTQFNDPNFRALPANTSQQIIKMMFKDIKSWYEAVKAYKKDPSKFTGRPRMPYYKKKLSSLYFTTNQVKLKNGYVHFPKMLGFKPIKTNITNLNFCRITPRDNHFVVEFVYVVKDTEMKADNGRVIGIDLGVNNLATVVSTTGDAFIINGKPIKSINQYYHKVKAQKQSLLPKGVDKSRAIDSLTQKRNQKIKDYLHKVAKYIVQYCIANDITTIVIGKNDQWKTGSNMGKKNNQNFTSIPHATLINLIEYKAKLKGIVVVTVEESYTSKCSSLDLEPLMHQENYVGSRVQRGLFRTKTKKLINADCNGAVNIIRKVFGDVMVTNSIESCVVQPYKVNLDSCQDSTNKIYFPVPTEI